MSLSQPHHRQSTAGNPNVSRNEDDLPQRLQQENSISIVETNISSKHENDKAKISQEDDKVKRATESSMHNIIEESEEMPLASPSEQEDDNVKRVTDSNMHTNT